MPFSAYGAKAVLDWTLGGASATRPSSRFLGLASSVPTSVSAFEASFSGYARQAMTFGAATSITGSGSASASNSNTINFASYTQSSYIIRGFQIWDATTGGNMLFYGSIVAPSASFTLASGNQLQYPPASIKI